MAKKKTSKALIPTERIEQSILLIRGQKVLLDSDLADLYGNGTRLRTSGAISHHGGAARVAGERL